MLSSKLDRSVHGDGQWLLSRVVGILNIDKAGAGILVLIWCFVLLLYLAPPASLFLINLWPKLLSSFSFPETSRELPSKSISFSRKILFPETFFCTVPFAYDLIRDRLYACARAVNSDYNMATPVRRNAMRATMSHVVTQWENGQWLRESLEPRRARASSEYLRPIVYPTAERNSPGLRTKKSLNFPGTPESNLWDFGSIRHIKQSSKEMQPPDSPVDSIFELPCNEPHKSPNSSTHSSFIAELEDTSPVAIHKRILSPASSTSLSMPSSPTRPKGLHLRDKSMEVKGDGNTVSLSVLVALYLD